MAKKKSAEVVVTEPVTTEKDVTDESEEDTDDESEDETEEEPEKAFTREYVEGLRADVGRYRTRANAYAKRLHTELVKQTGRLADPDLVEFNEEHLSDPEKLTATIDSILEEKPYAKSRRVQGDVDQGKRGDDPESTDILSVIRTLL
jgi:hypothetical protein